MSTSGTSEVPTLATASTAAVTPHERTARGVTTRKGTKNVDNATTEKGGNNADGATTKRRRRKVEPTIATIDASLKWQPKQSIFEVVPEHDWDNFMALTRKAWLETPDQGIDVGDYRSHVACKELLSFAIFRWTDPRGVLTTVIREQIPASGESRDTLDKGLIARRVELAVDRGMASDPVRVQPPKDLVMFRLAQIMLNPDGRKKDLTRLAAYLGGKCGKKGTNKEKFFKPYYEALDGLWRKHDTWPAVQAEYDAKSEEVKEAMETINQTWKPRTATKRSQYEQFDRDELAAANPSILIRVPKDVIHITTDCDGKVLTFRWPKALQWFFGDDLVEKTAEHIEEYARHHQPKFPDPGRHAMNPYWCRKHPDFPQNDKDKNAKVPLGVFHFGCGGETGKRDQKPLTKPDSKDDKLMPEVIRLREEMMREGVMPWVTRAHKFVQGILDPELLAAQMEVVRRYEPELRRPTIEEDPFALRAILVNALTTDHRDQSDWKKGIALMLPAGDFTGADLCCRQLAMRAAYEAGTIAAIRGGEVHHCTTEWQGKTRYSIVHTCGEQLRAYVKLMDGKGEERPTAAIDEMGGLEEEEQEEDEDEEEEAAGTVQKPIELYGTPSEPSSDEEASGSVQNPIDLEISPTPSPVSKKRKRES